MAKYIDKNGLSHFYNKLKTLFVSKATLKQSISTSLGYTPADAQKVAQMEQKMKKCIFFK